MKQNVRAGAYQGATVDSDHRWFRLECYTQDKQGFGHVIDFPSRARSDATRCHGCREPINREVLECQI